MGYEIPKFQFPRSFQANITVLQEVAGKIKNFPHKANAICGEKRETDLNSKLASNIVLTANFQSNRVVLTEEVVRQTPLVSKKLTV